jgi:glycosyltransferase involved in cell wall biosynthesis
MNWTLWQNIVSPHLSPVARALASIPGQTVTVVAENELPERRRATGWRTPDCSPARVLIKPTNAEIERLIAGDPGQPSVHLLSGLPDVALNQRVLALLARTRATVGLISETADNRGILGFVRKVKYRLDRRHVEQNIDFVLAMGQLGVKWFESAGYDSSRIFPFAYVTERPVITEEKYAESMDREAFRILFLGRILRLKDGVTAIRALQRLSTSEWQFDVVGDGPDQERWKKAAAHSGVANRIRFRPTVDNGLVGNLLQQADLLLLPSRKDGWGAVINEALMCGVPVICSDNCGAADLLREPWRGSTFKAGSVASLRRVLLGWIERGRRSDKSSARIREWSRVVEGPQVVRYLVEIVAYVRAGGQRPSPPWY